MIPWWRTEFGADEIAAVTRAIEGRHISQGKITRQFEEALAERLGVPYVLCTTSGTTALTMALLAAGIGAGDEVIMPNRTWVATAHACLLIGAKPVLCDVGGYVPIIDEAEIEALITRRTKAILPVHLNGRIANMPAILEIAHANNLTVIEDACQAFPQAPAGDAACYSLSTAKIIATGQGGFVATRSEAIYRELKALRTHDVEDAMVPQVLKWRRFGYNFRFTDLQAAMGLAQLSKLDARIAAVRQIHDLYRRQLGDWRGGEFLPIPGYSVALYNELLSPQSEAIRAHLYDCGIESRPFYPSLHTAPYLNASGTYPQSARYEHGLILPSGPQQSIADIMTVCEALTNPRIPSA